jgi:hypothetical protein
MADRAIIGEQPLPARYIRSARVRVLFSNFDLHLGLRLQLGQTEQHEQRQKVKGSSHGCSREVYNSPSVRNSFLPQCWTPEAIYASYNQERIGGRKPC